ncbi:urease accessory protein UreD [Celeribacter sp.]|uniref:urease accessory protein UreD n=1 Tax=Celeribacter sp. TaxID=1890673 RepID=UPI003A8E8ED4
MIADLPLETNAVFQRARGTLDVSAVRAAGDITRLKNLHQQGSYRAIFPRPTNEAIEMVIINTAGGVTGGDQFSTTITAHERAKLSVTTQAAERIYRASNATAGTIKTKLTVEDGAELYWLPQETILFDGARLRRKIDIELHENATFLMLEPLVFGRDASGESLRSGALTDRVSITSGGRPVYLDAITLDGDITATLERSALASGARAVANIVLVSPDAALLCDAVRALLPSTGGASLLSETTLVIRVLARDSFVLRQTLLPILTHLTHATVPKNWRL